MILTLTERLTQAGADYPEQVAILPGKMTPWKNSRMPRSITTVSRWLTGSAGPE